MTRINNLIPLRNIGYLFREVGNTIKRRSRTFYSHKLIVISIFLRMYRLEYLLMNKTHLYFAVTGEIVVPYFSSSEIIFN